MKQKGFIKIGTCSWKYDSWRGLVYSQDKSINYLQEYSRNFSTVEIDQWFWSLFKGGAVVLPKAEVVQEYAASVPPGFIFSIKIPNSITLTHQYTKKSAPLVPNPHFLSTELMDRFLSSIEPLDDHIGPLMFQFEYLNKKKMADLGSFLEMFEAFRQQLPGGHQYGLEIRNPNYLTESYFSYLADHDLGHVFLQGYYMPSIFGVFEKYKALLKDPVVIRLHGGDRGEIEKRTNKKWNEIVEPKDEELVQLGEMLSDLGKEQHQVYLNVNNHYEGSAPRTIDRIRGIVSEVPKSTSLE